MSQQKRPFSQMEEEVLKHWEQNNIFEKSLQKGAPKGDFIFYEGPPTANGRPGIHHLEARAFKDVIPRYKTMRGYHVRRKGGWDTHGLPVEIEVEKELGLKSKKDVEAYGVEKFNAKCRESVWKYLEDWKKFTRRIGYWVDLENPYVTYDPRYIESLWAVVKKIWDDGRLYKDYKVLPWCPRCGTALSSHELAQGYKDVKELSVTAKFNVVSGSHNLLRSETRTAFLAWTTTPWTLPGNVGLAVGANLSYVVIEKDDEGTEGRVRFVLAKDLLAAHFGENGYDIVGELKGSDIIGTSYEPLYPFMQNLVTGEEKAKLERNAYKVYAADFVTTEEGTGIVHTAVMYGQDDFVLGTKVGLPKHHLVNLDGTFVDGTDFLARRFVKEKGLDVDIIKDLAHRGLLFDKKKFEHSYPHCWRCKTPLIYYARDSWYIRMSEVREEMIAQNKEINWEPSHIRDGRFGEWLDGVKDWAISRERYWATPLPIWESANGDRICIGSFEELRALAKDPSKVGDDFDPHRPFVDDVVLERDGKEFVRVKEVMDVWFDSGAMPFAQDHYPFENKEWVEGVGYPADYIAEAIDQTRGWFYTLHAVGVLMGRGKAYRNVISLGHVLDAEGKKMSKSVGNVVDPWKMIERYGADALRWWMYTVNQPGESKNFDEKSVDEIVKKVFMILWNVKAFYEMYHRLEVRGWRLEVGQNHVLDVWVVARLDGLVADVTERLDAYRVLEAARAIGAFITDVSQWYVRRSRDRFKSGDAHEKAAAVATLRHVLLTLSKLMAPFAPFTAEKLYRDLGGEKDSVHLEDWPEARALSAHAKEMLAQMARVRELVTKTLEAREVAKVPVRQALSSVAVQSQEPLDEAHLEILKDEVNVQRATWKKGELSVQLDTNITPELRRLGIVRELVRRANALRKSAELSLEDTIVLSVETEDADVAAALLAHEAEILERIRATKLERALDNADKKEDSAHGGFRLGLK